MQCIGGFDGIHHHYFFDGGCFPNGQDFFQLCLCGDDDHPRSRIAQNVPGLLGGQSRVDRHNHDTQEKRCEIRDCPLVPIFTENGQPIALGQAPMPESSRHASHVTVKLLRSHGNPLRCLAMQHHGMFPALDDGKEDVVKSLRLHDWAQRLCLYATFNCVRAFSWAPVGVGSTTGFGSRGGMFRGTGIGTDGLGGVAETFDSAFLFRRGFFSSGGLIPTAVPSSTKLSINSFSSLRRSGAACTSPLKPKYTMPL